MIIAISLVVSAVFLALVYVALPNRAVAVVVCLTSTLVFGLCFSMPIALQGLLTALVVVATGPLHWKRPVVMAAAVAVMLVVYAGMMISVVDELRELEELRAQYPVKSIADRLSYESTHASGESHQRQVPVLLATGVETRLKQQEGMYQSNSRTYRLQALHHRSADQFVIARGFGPSRMVGVGRSVIEMPDPGPVALLPHDDSYTPDAAGELVEPEEWTADESPSPERLLTMHQSGQLDFLNPERMGFIEERQQVAGFEAHRFESVPSPGHPCGPTIPWQVVRLELVSLLKHATPVAYISKHLPRMDELQKASTRPLNGFEHASLEKLQAEKDVVIEESDRRIRMVGSLRAAQDCLSCHNVERGALLGALTYELSPVRPALPALRTDTEQEPQAGVPPLEFLVDAE